MSEFFVPVPQIETEEARAFLQKSADESYTILDVRQEDEFRVAHLPGATLIPLDQLPDRIKDLDPQKPTLVYCRSGGRSASGTSLLVSAGFEKVWNMDGGIIAWRGLVAWGAPKASMAWFDPARTEADYIALAWMLEQSARKFYATMAEQNPDAPDGFLFTELASEEEGHMTLLLKTYQGATQTDAIAHIVDRNVEPQMEGGVPLGDAIAWAEDRSVLEILEFSVAAEANAYDRYLKIANNVKDEQIRKAFFELAEAEKTHLSRLSQAFQKQLSTQTA